MNGLDDSPAFRPFPLGIVPEGLSEREKEEQAAYKRYARGLSVPGLCDEMGEYDREIARIGELLLNDDDADELGYLGAVVSDLRRWRDILNVERHTRRMAGLLPGGRAVGLDPQDIRDLKERVSLVAAIEAAGFPLKKKGREHWGLCPFHAEKSASFHVNEQKGLYFCHSCGAHGDVYSFLQKVSNISFPEAVKRLADVLGVELPRTGSSAC